MTMIVWFVRKLFYKKKLPNRDKKFIRKTFNNYEKNYFYNIDKSYKGNKNDIIYEKEIEEITFNDGTSYKR